MSLPPEDPFELIAALQAQVAALQAQIAASSSGVAQQSGGTHYGPAVGNNLGTIIYDRTPHEDERQQLVRYLDVLAATLNRLPLRGMVFGADLDSGDGLALSQVYTLAATENVEVVARGTAEELTAFIDGLRILSPYHPHQVLPDKAIKTIRRGFSGNPEQDKQLILLRSRLASEAIAKNRRLVLLGDPGGGKSTLLRHLAWAMAQHQLNGTALPPGWHVANGVLPILLPLRTLAGVLASDAGQNQLRTVYNALLRALRDVSPTASMELLSAALQHGAALILFDELDEVPLEAGLGFVDRVTVVSAVQAFAQSYHQARVVVSCRNRAFDRMLRNTLGWPVETLAPFTLGQIRHFVPTWYGELKQRGVLGDLGDPVRLSAQLLDAIIARPQLREMAATPLLLTMMALILQQRGVLPRDRTQLYERIFEVLLGAWDQVRAGQSLQEAIGQPGWDSSRIVPLLDQLSYQAHLAGTSEDGRGRLARSTVRDALIDFFTEAKLGSPWAVAGRCLDYIEHRSGLLVPDGPELVCLRPPDPPRALRRPPSISRDA